MTLWRRVMNERRGLVWPLLIGLAVNLAVLGLGVFPLQASVSGDEDRAIAAKMQLAEAQKLERTANDTRGSQVRADQELKQFYSEVLPATHAQARDLLYVGLRTIAQQNNLGFASSNTASEPMEESSLTRMNTNVSLFGDYANIRRFLYDLESAQEFFVVDSVKLAPSSRKEGGSLQVLLGVTTYYMGVRR
jgi:Tfp pilus assembly protein PilO